MKNFDYDIALLMKKTILENGLICYFPIKVIEGIYCDEENCFVDFDSTPYFHIISGTENYGFMDRESMSELKKIYPYLTNYKIKNNKLKKAKKDFYIYLDEMSNPIAEIPIIGTYDVENKKIVQLFDGDIYKYYFDNYNDYFITGLYKGDVEDIKLNSNKKEQLLKEENVDINKIYSEITSRVIGQDKPVKEILGAIFDQLDKDEDEKIDNILINGDTGVGKTEIFRILSKLIDVPCVVTAATQYSATGYVGSSVEDMLISLVNKAKGDIKKAERGILIIDEIDKISETDRSNSHVNKKDVQDAILKILEDGVIPITIGNKEYDFDASKLIVVGMGSWSGIELNQEKTIGFGKEPVAKKTYKDVSSKDMVDNGMSRDLIGRFDIIVKMNDLTFDNYKEILKSKHNILSQHKKRLEKKGVELIISDDLINAIANMAVNSQFGARDLRKIVEKALVLAEYEVRSKGYLDAELIINEETLKDNSKYVLRKK